MFRALDLGADVSLISTTKYYDGHNLTVGGCLVSKTKEHDDQMHFWLNVHGNIMSPQVAFYQLQTCKTMHLRVAQQAKSALAIATFLEGHPMVDVVHYPGLQSFPH